MSLATKHAWTPHSRGSRIDRCSHCKAQRMKVQILPTDAASGSRPFWLYKDFFDDGKTWTTRQPKCDDDTEEA